MENASMEALDKDEWHPPDAPLTVSDIQRGVLPSFKVKSERASRPFVGELEHWSALPALSYFALNAVAMRESMRRITPSSTFHPPPRLTLSDKRKDMWFNELRDLRVPLRQLSRAIPHCYTSNMLLDVLMDKEIPVPRAVWFIKCIGANQVRALKRKASASNTAADSHQMAQLFKNIESQWLSEWTKDVIAYVTRVIDSYGSEKWKQHMRFASQITLHLYDSMLLCQKTFLTFLLKELREASILRLPCIVHLAELLWKPLTSPQFSHKFFKSIAYRYNDEHHPDFEQFSMILEPILLKLATTNEDAFVAPRTWQIIEPLIRNHPAYGRLAERNQSFMVANPHGPSGWQLHLEAGAILDNFVRPYKVDELMQSLLSLGLDTSVIVNVVLTWTVRQSTNASIQLCCALLRGIAADNSSVPMLECCVDFLFDPHLIHGSECLGSLLNELLSARLCHLGMYIQKIISTGVLYSEGPTRDLHLRIFKSLPFDRLTPGIRTQVEMILFKVKEPLPEANIQPFLDSALQLFNEKSWNQTLHIHELSVNDHNRLADRLVKLYEGVLSSLPSSPNLSLTPTILVRFLDIVESASCASMKPLYRVLSLTLSSELSGPSMVSCVLRQVHVRLMAFVCSGQIDAFASKLIAKLQWSAYNLSGAMELVGMNRYSTEVDTASGKLGSSTNNNSHALNSNSNSSPQTDIFQWVAWDDVSALRAVIQTPSIMVELNRIVPLRLAEGSFNTATWGHTPNDLDMVKQLLYRPGSPDVSALLSLRGEEQLAAPIVEYAQSPGADRTSLLQLVTYGAVTIEELGNSHPDKFGMLRFLLLEPANELGFALSEVETLKVIRKSYLENVSIKELFALSSSVAPVMFLSRAAHLYPDIFLHRMLPELTESPELSSIILNHPANSAIESHTKTFNDLLKRCTPFNLRYYQGLTVLVLHGKPIDEVVDVIFYSAFSQPESSSALQGLLQNLSDEVKTAIFIRTVDKFFKVGLESEHLALVDVYVTLVTALGNTLSMDAPWDLNEVPQFLDILVKRASEVPVRQLAVGSDKQCDDMLALRKALSLVLRICVVGRLHGVTLPAAALPYLEKLLHIQVFADNYRVRTFIKDSLCLLLRISTSSEHSETTEQGTTQVSFPVYPSTKQPPLAVTNNALSAYVPDESNLSAGLTALDGLRLYSKKHNTFSALPVWAFDLIEDANPQIKRNDGCVDLSFFESYED